MKAFSLIESGRIDRARLGTDYPFVGIPMAEIRRAFDHPGAVDVVYCMLTLTAMPVIPRKTPVPAVGQVA